MKSAARTPAPTTTDRLGPAMTFAILLGLYAWSAPRTVTLEDDGFFILASWFGGIAHPPGYPLHTMLGWLFAHVPAGSVALRVHLASAVCGAAACAVLAHVARLCGTGRTAAVVGAVALGLSDAFWSQAIIAEVYALNALLFFGALALCLHARRSSDLRWLLAAAVVVGLGCANHWPLFAGSAPALAVVAWPRRRLALRAAPRLVGCFALGLLPYAWLVVRSQMNPPITFYGPVDDWRRFWFMVLSKGYAQTRVNPLLGWQGTWDQLVFWGTEALHQFTPIGAVAAAVGCVLAWRQWPRGVAAGVTLGAVATPALLLVAVNQPMDDHLNRAVMRVFPLLSYGMLALWIAVAVDALGRRALLGALLPAALLALNAGSNVRRDDRWAADYARAMLDSFPSGAVVFVHADVDTGPLGYLHLVEGIRPDVTLYNSQGLVLPHRAAPPWADPTTLARETGALIDRTTAPLYAFPEPPPFFSQLVATRGGIEDLAFEWRIDRSLRPGARTVRADPTLMAYLDRVLAADHLTDAWEIHHRNRLIGQAGWMLGTLLARDPAAATRLGERVNRVGAHYLGRVRMVDAVAASGDPATLLARLGGAEALLDGTFRVEDRALLLVLRGRLRERLGDLAAAIGEYEAALRIMPEPRNPAVAHLARLYARLGRRVELAALRRRFGL